MLSRKIWRLLVAVVVFAGLTWSVVPDAEISENSAAVNTGEVWRSRFKKRGKCVMEFENICLSEKGVHFMAVPDPSGSAVKQKVVNHEPRRLSETAVLSGLVLSVVYLAAVENARMVVVALYACLSVLGIATYYQYHPVPTSPQSADIAATTPSDIPDFSEAQIPYCQEMAPGDPPLASIVDRTPVTQGEIIPGDTPAYILGTTPFWLTPWHLWLNSIAAFDTIQKYNYTKKADIFVEWYLKGKRWRWMPSFYPVLRDPKVEEKFSMYPLISAMGRSSTSFRELPKGKRLCYKSAVSGGLLWDSLPRGNNKSFGVHFKKQLVRDYANQVASEMKIDLMEMWDDGCRVGQIQAYIIQRDKTAGRSIVNAEEVSTLLKRKKYAVTVLKLEGIPLTRQWRIFTTADVIVSAFGSGLSWLPLMRRGGVVLSVIPTKGAGGDKYHRHLSGPKDEQNRHTAFGTWAQHLNYYTAYSKTVPNENVKKWKQQSVIIDSNDLNTFVSKVDHHLTGKRKSCNAW